MSFDVSGHIAALADIGHRDFLRIPAGCQRHRIVIVRPLRVGLDYRLAVVLVAVVRRHAPADSFVKAVGIGQIRPVLAVPEHAFLRIPARQRVAVAGRRHKFLHGNPFVQVDRKVRALRGVHLRVVRAQIQPDVQAVVNPNRIDLHAAVGHDGVRPVHYRDALGQIPVSVAERGNLNAGVRRPRRKGIIFPLVGFCVRVARKGFADGDGFALERRSPLRVRIERQDGGSLFDGQRSLVIGNRIVGGHVRFAVGDFRVAWGNRARSRARRVRRQLHRREAVPRRRPG